MTSPAKIVSILPRREGFSPKHFGAISLCVKEFTEHSCYKSQTLIMGGADENGFEGLRYRYIAHRKRPLQSRTLAYVAAIAKEKSFTEAKLIEVHNRPNMIAPLRRKLKGKLALHFHNDPQTMRGCKTVKQREKILMQCDAIYCVSDYIKRRFCEGLTPSANLQNNIHVIYNGIDFSRVPQTSIKQKQIIYIGRMQPEKGVLEFVTALKQVLPNHKDWSALLIGAAQHKPDHELSDYERDLKHHCAPLKSQIQMLGFCDYDTTMQHLGNSYIAVVPSKWNEAFGRIALEAMANRCATISTHYGGLKEVVNDAVYLLTEVSAATISKAIIALIEDSETRNDLGSRGRKRANYFEISKVTESLDAVRKNLLEAAR